MPAGVRPARHPPAGDLIPPAGSGTTGQFCHCEWWYSCDAAIGIVVFDVLVMKAARRICRQQAFTDRCGHAVIFINRSAAECDGERSAPRFVIHGAEI